MDRLRPSEKKEINVIVGENIRKYREASGYNREYFAELLDISTRFLCDVETGYTGVSITTLRKICELLGISADRLLWNMDTPLALDELVSHVEPKYHSTIRSLLRTQLELIAMAGKEDRPRKTRS